MSGEQLKPDGCKRLPNNTFCPDCGYSACRLRTPPPMTGLPVEARRLEAVRTITALVEQREKIAKSAARREAITDTEFAAELANILDYATIQVRVADLLALLAQPVLGEGEAASCLREMWEAWCADTDGDDVFSAYGETVKRVLAASPPPLGLDPAADNS